MVSGIGHSGMDGALDTLSAHAAAAAAGAGRATKDVLMAASSSSSNVEDEPAKMRKFEAAAMEAIKSGQLVVFNGDGTYRCPFCPTKGYQAYKHPEIYSHAKLLRVGSETRGQHRALLNILHEELIHHAEQVTPRICEFLQEELTQRAAIISPGPGVVKFLQPAPKRVRPDNRVVHPWVGIICNINSTELSLQRMLPGTGGLREHYSHFQPQKVKTFCANDGPGLDGVAVLVFGRDMKAYANCRSFEASFQAVHRGRSDWERCKAAGQEGTDPDLYGWMAMEEDYYDAGKAGQFLRKKKYQVTTMHDVVEEKIKTIHGQQQLKKQVELEGVMDQQKAEMLSRAEAEKLRLSIDILSRKGPSEQALWRELEMHLLESRNQEDTESLSAGSQQTLELHNQQMGQPARELDAKMASLQVGCEDISTKESQNEALEFGKPEKQKQLEIVTNSTD